MYVVADIGSVLCYIGEPVIRSLALNIRKKSSWRRKELFVREWRLVLKKALAKALE